MSFLYFLEGLRNPVLDGFFAAITALGEETALLAVAIIIFWCFSKKNGFYLMTVGFFGTLINQCLKLVCRIPRPWVKDPNFTIVEAAREEATGYSFPSGHTASVMATLGCPAKTTKKRWLKILCSVLIALTALSRMWLGVHTPADVIVSVLIGIILLFVLHPIFEKSDRDPKPMFITLGILAAASLAFLLFVECNAWPADIDPHNLESGVKNGYLLFGCSTGMLLSAWIDRKYIKFDVKAVWWVQLIKVAVGLALVLGIKAGLKPVLVALFNGHMIETGIRYFAIVMFAACVWPLTFKWFAKLGEKKGKAE